MKRVYDYRSPFILGAAILLWLLGVAALIQAGLGVASSGIWAGLPFVFLAALFGYVGLHEFKVYRNEKIVLENNHLKYYTMHGQMELDEPVHRIEAAYTTRGLVEVLTIRFTDGRLMTMYSLMSNFDQMKMTAFELADQAAARPEVAELGGGVI